MQVLGVGQFAPSTAQIGTLLRPIATPLVMAGFGGEVADLARRRVPRAGFAADDAARGGTRGDATPSTAAQAGRCRRRQPDRRRPASSARTGTVTHVDGDRVYAFGHPFYNLGPTEFPMTRAYVHTCCRACSRRRSWRRTGEVIGTFQQDRATAIAGTLGAGPRMIPVTLALETDARPTRTFKFQVVSDQLFTPLLTYVAILNTLSRTSGSSAPRPSP